VETPPAGAGQFGQPTGWSTPTGPGGIGQEGQTQPPGTYLASDGNYYPLADQGGFSGPGQPGLGVGEPEPPKRKRRGLLVGAAVVAALVVAGGGTYAVLSLRGGAGGAGSPEKAAEALLQDLTSLDYGKIVAHVAPSETTLIDPMVDAVEGQDDQTEQAQKVWSDIQAALTIKFEDLSFTTENLAEGVARTAVTGGTVSVDADTAKLTTAIMDLNDLGGSVLGSMYTGMGDVTESDIADQLDGLFPVSKAIDDLAATAGLEDLFVVTVEEDGKWFTSLSMTAAQYAFESAGLDPGLLGDPIPDGEMNGASSPEKALDNLTAALRATGEKGDLRELAKALPPAESRLLAVYGPALTDSLGGSLGALTALEALTGSGYSEVGGHGRVTIDSLIVSPWVTLTRSDNTWTLRAGDDASNLTADLTQESDTAWKFSATMADEWSGEQSVSGSIEVTSKGVLDAVVSTPDGDTSLTIEGSCVTVDTVGYSEEFCEDDLGVDLADTPLASLEKLPDLKGILALSAVKGAGGDWYISPTASVLDWATVFGDSLK
jgi:hypothetical protein